MAWTILSDEVLAGPERSRPYVMGRCDCGAEQLVNLRELKRGNTSGCQSCGGKRRAAARGFSILDTPGKRQLAVRVRAARARCTNPKNKGYHNYGGRGIEFRFSVRDCVEYLWRLFPLENYNGLEVDRVDNNKHYEWGNLRLCDKSTNISNRRPASEWTRKPKET
jgi:hypothetical protein